MRLSFLNSEIRRIADSVAVPIRLAISSLVRVILMYPSASFPNRLSKIKNISANRSLTVFWANSVILF